MSRESFKPLALSEAPSMAKAVSRWAGVISSNETPSRT